MNFYRILDISIHADKEEIKKAFRIQAKKYHPDISDDPQANEKFRLAYIAYEILTDPFKRELYNYFLSKRRSGSPKVQRWRGRADRRANSYANMQYEEFENTIIDRINFHGKQSVAFILFFLMLCLGLISFMTGMRMVFALGFSLDTMSGYILLTAGVAFSYFSISALWGVLNSWKA